MPSGQLIIEGQYLGGFRYQSQADDSWGWMSRAYFCPHCGDIWGRLIIEKRDGSPQLFQPTVSACREHDDPWNIPGSILLGELSYNLDELSRETLARELDVHLSYYEKMI